MCTTVYLSLATHTKPTIKQRFSAKSLIAKIAVARIINAVIKTKLVAILWRNCDILAVLSPSCI